jgi:beta-lactam-binding protein with PASTA domain
VVNSTFLSDLRMGVRHTSLRVIFIRGGRAFLILATLGLVFAMGVAAMLYVAMHKPTVTVPNVAGQRLSQAQEMTREAGLELEVRGRTYNDILAADTVVDQWPRAGMTVKRGQALRVNLSMGPSDFGRTRPGN